MVRKKKPHIGHCMLQGGALIAKHVMAPWCCVVVGVWVIVGFVGRSLITTHNRTIEMDAR